MVHENVETIGSGQDPMRPLDSGHNGECLLLEDRPAQVWTSKNDQKETRKADDVYRRGLLERFSEAPA